MALISMHGVSIGFGGAPLLDQVDLHIARGDRACLVGRNGVGKTTLLRILAGELEPDAGHVRCYEHAQTAYLPQRVPAQLGGRVADIVATGCRATHTAGAPADRRAMTMCGVDPEADFATLSGGMQRRVLLARALASEPDVLLLDEPTNHLDIPAIEWLETFLARQAPTVLFITHDRAFLRKLATRIIDLDRGRLADWACDYDTFLRRKADLLEDEATRQARFDLKLSKEEVWIRQGIKARRTRNEGRVKALEAMRRERVARRTADGVARLNVQAAARSGTLVVKAEEIAFAYGEQPIVANLSTVIMRGDKVGIIGPNGCGKTTLLRLLLGQQAITGSANADNPPSGYPVPQAGALRRGTNLQVAYFDQHRAVLNDHATVLENVADGREAVEIDGVRRHVYSYLQDFLFTPERAQAPVSVLSGGERNRLLLARLFAQPANVLVMDEPTNDLDIETLELLEEQLVNYTGTLLIVSHDRQFLNNVVTSTLVFEDGGIREYPGGYDDWLRQREGARREDAGVSVARPTPPRERQRTRSTTNRERGEFAELPNRIARLEGEQEVLQATMATPAFYQQSREAIADAQERAAALAHMIEAAYIRWAELEAMFDEPA
jgi:ABC transport system ATP-binding/permease protein